MTCANDKHEPVNSIKPEERNLFVRVTISSTPIEAIFTRDRRSGVARLLSRRLTSRKARPPGGRHSTISPAHVVIAAKNVSGPPYRVILES
jgi:hypothetical protein